jgi:Uma2 family endonuclease
MIKDEIFNEEGMGYVEQAEDYTIQRDKPMPSRNHGIIQLRLGAALLRHYDDKYNLMSEIDLSPIGVKPSVPDICIYPKSPIDLLEDEIRVTEPPITAIEILSPMQGMEELKNKFYQIYFPAGVKSAWLVVPTLRSVHIFTPDRKFTTFNSGTLHDPATGISLGLDEFFPK